MKVSRIASAIILIITLMLLIMPLESASANPGVGTTGPTNFKVTYYPPDILRFSWKNNEPFDEYELLYSRVCPDANYPTLIYKVKANPPAFNFKMPNGCQIQFTMRVYLYMNDAYLTWGSGRINIPPLSPSSAKVIYKSNTFNISWTDNSKNEGMMAIIVGGSSGYKVFGYKSNTTSAAIPASAIPASAKNEITVVTISKAGSINILNRDDFKPGNAIPASILNELKFPRDNITNVKYLVNSTYIPLVFSSNIVVVNK